MWNIKAVTIVEDNGINSMEDSYGNTIYMD